LINEGSREIGDRFRIGGAVVEVSQPRDTCYRVGIRLNHPFADLVKIAAKLGVTGIPRYQSVCDTFV